MQEALEAYEAARKPSTSRITSMSGVMGQVCIGGDACAREA